MSKISEVEAVLDELFNGPLIAEPNCIWFTNPRDAELILSHYNIALDRLYPVVDK